MGGGAFESIGSRGRKVFAPAFHQFVPQVIPVGSLIAGNDQVRVFLVGLSCWPGGFTLDVSAFFRPEAGPGDVRRLLGHPLDPAATLDPDGLSLAVAFADGRKATTLDPVEPGLDVDDPLALSPASFSCSLSHLRQGIYVRPVPPDGPVVVSVRWTAKGLDESAVELSGAELAAGSTSARPVWGEPDR